MADRLQAGRSGLQMSLHGLAPSYLADELHHPAESEFRRRLHSPSSHELPVPRTQLSTYGDRAFPITAVRIWNSLPQHITSVPSLPVFCSCLKTYFFELCYPWLLLSCPQSDTVIYGHVNRSYLLTSAYGTCAGQTDGQMHRVWCISSLPQDGR